MALFAVILTPPFSGLVSGYSREHPNLEEDLKWILGRLEVDPERMGNHVPELGKLKFPIYKTRCKDSCHSLGASGAWRIYYALDKSSGKVFLLFIHHKSEYALPRRGYLLQKLERALED